MTTSEEELPVDPELVLAEGLIMGSSCNCRACRHLRTEYYNGATYHSWKPEDCAQYNPNAW